jgi:hypothetical protein
MFETAGLRILSRGECLALLAAAPVGRIVFTDRALPAVQLVNYLLDGDHIVIRTRAGSKLAAAARRAVVAFEIDEIDAADHAGWTVTVVGEATVVRAPEEVSRLAALPLRPWAPGVREDFIRVKVDLVDGRRLGLAPAGGPDGARRARAGDRR